MVKKKNIPNAWDDDWEVQADEADQVDGTPEPKAPVTKAERMARHEEANRKLWESADSPQEFHFLAASNTSNAPPSTTTAFKPAMKVLSRKPAPLMIAKRDPITGIEQMTLQDDDAEEEPPRVQLSPQEIRMRQQREREEKQRRYDEARAKIFGTDTKSNPSSGQSTPGTVTPPEGRQNNHNHSRNNRGGRGRGGYRGDGGQSHNRQDSQGRRPANQPGNRELFDPGYTPKPGFAVQKRGGSENSSPQPSTPRNEDYILRAPKGPDGSGRGGFGFAKHSGREG